MYNQQQQQTAGTTPMYMPVSATVPLPSQNQPPAAYGQQPATTTTSAPSASSPPSTPKSSQHSDAGKASSGNKHGSGKNASTPIVPHGNQYHMAVVGGGSVGKSCLTIQFVKHFFVTDYDPTIEDSYRSQVVIDGSACILNIMDTAGQDLYSAMRDHYYRSGEGFLLVYSVATRLGYDDIDQLRAQILRVKEDYLVNETVPMVLVANKIDLTDERVISTAEGQAKANAWRCPYIETSAKTRINVDEVFFTLVREIRRFYILAQEQNRPEETPHVSIFKRLGCVLL